MSASCAFSRNARVVAPAPSTRGVYLLSRRFLEIMLRSDGPSFERDVLERQPPGTLLSHLTHGRFLDIGTPESLTQAPTVLGLEPPP